MIIVFNLIQSCIRNGENYMTGISFWKGLNKHSLSCIVVKRTYRFFRVKEEYGGHERRLAKVSVPKKVILN
ncbi:hypothetical protein DHB64_01115 [Antarcticibacterium sp. W02-3]|nr:hypothetical protein [Antarcticibacterium sp. W02-3]